MHARSRDRDVPLGLGIDALFMGEICLTSQG